MASLGSSPPITRLSHLSTDTDTVLNHYMHYHKSEHTAERKENPREMVQSYYELATDFYEYGYGKSFHFCPVYDGKTLAENIVDYEIGIAESLGAKAGMKLLDVGSGVGGPARNIAKHTGASITGINCSDYQIRRSRELSLNAGLHNLCTFDKGDFCRMNMYDDNTFDGAYAIESICHSKDPLMVYKEMYRVLKPGALMVESEWVTTNKYEEGNVAHEKVIDKILVGNALPELRTRQTILAKLEEAGFEIVECIDNRLKGDLPWYTFLVGKGCFSLQSFRASWFGRTFTHYSLTALELVHIVPAGTSKVHSMLCTGADGLVGSGKLDIFTPLLRIVARKPVRDD